MLESEVVALDSDSTAEWISVNTGKKLEEKTDGEEQASHQAWTAPSQPCRNFQFVFTTIQHK